MESQSLIQGVLLVSEGPLWDEEWRSSEETVLLLLVHLMKVEESALSLSLGQ